MPDRASPVWNLRESGQACAQLNSLARRDGFEEIWTAVRWLIIRNPCEVGQLVPGKQRTYALRTEDFLAIGLPEVIISYSLLDTEKRLLEIIDVLLVHNDGTDLAKTG
jgi:hypothetical protein